MSDESLNNGPDREEQRPGGAAFSAREMQASAAGSSSVGAGCARGRGFDVEEYAERIYRANIKPCFGRGATGLQTNAGHPPSDTDRRELV
jgi:hypothetical protein